MSCNVLDVLGSQDCYLSQWLDLEEDKVRRSPASNGSSGCGKPIAALAIVDTQL